MIISDNSDVQGLAAIPEYLRGMGFGRVDFFGRSPTGVREPEHWSSSNRRSVLHRDEGMPTSSNSHTEALVQVRPRTTVLGSQMGGLRDETNLFSSIWFFIDLNESASGTEWF